ncbi:MAG: PAS domain S-box protein, partial [Smithellaceae bacterium]
MARTPERRKTVRRKDEESLRSSEEKYRTILENIEEGYYEVDLAGNYIFFNDSLCRILGSSHEGMAGMNYRQYADKENAKKLFQGFNEIYRTGVPTKIVDYEITRKDGTRCYLETSASLLRDSSGKTIGFRGVVRDVTEHKKSKEALRRSEERYQTILEDIEEGYFEMDLAGNATYFNDSICRIFGYPREELMGMNYKQYTDKENREKCFQIYSKVYKTGKSDKVYDYEIIRKDGTTRNLETSLSLQKDSAGNPIGFRGVSRDITERKQAEEALRKSEEKYRNILESIEEGYYEVDLAGNMTFVNDSTCQIYGYPREELIGMNNRCYTSKETAKKVFQVFNEVYRTGKSNKGNEYEIIRRDGTKRYITSSVALRKDSSGKVIGFKGITKDITERKRAEDSLKESREELLKKNQELEESRKNIQITLERLG